MEKRILCVDDDREILEFLMQLFKDNGFDVRGAKDGLDAYEKAKQFKPHLITLDLDMPREWGTRFYRKLKKDPHLASIPIIVISGLSGTKYAVKDAVAVIDKPFEPNYLLNVVKQILSS